MTDAGIEPKDWAQMMDLMHRSATASEAAQRNSDLARAHAASAVETAKKNAEAVDEIRCTVRKLDRAVRGDGAETLGLRAEYEIIKGQVVRNQTEIATIRADSATRKSVVLNNVLQVVTTVVAGLILAYLAARAVGAA